MASYRQLLYHLVFRTKDNIPSIDQDHVERLYSYISGIIRNKNSHMYCLILRGTQKSYSDGGY